MKDYFTKSLGFPDVKLVTGNFYKPTSETLIRANDCLTPVRIRINWLNMTVPFPCGKCTVCKSKKIRCKYGL